MKFIQILFEMFYIFKIEHFFFFKYYKLHSTKI